MPPELAHHVGNALLLLAVLLAVAVGVGLWGGRSERRMAELTRWDINFIMKCIKLHFASIETDLTEFDIVSVKQAVQVLDKLRTIRKELIYGDTTESD